MFVAIVFGKVRTMSEIRRKVLARKHAYVEGIPSVKGGIAKSGRVKDALEIAVKAVTLTTTLAFVFSIAFDAGYFYWLGINIANAPTSLTDHVRTTLQWFPLFLVLSPILIGGNAFMLHLDVQSAKSAAARRESGEHKSRLPKFWLNSLTPLGRLGIMCLLPTLLGALLGGFYAPFQLFILPAFLLLFFDPVWRLLPDDLNGLAIKMNVLAVCTCVGAFTFMGIMQANREVLRPTFQRNVVLKAANNTLKTVDYVPLRQFEKFYLMLDKDSRPVFVKTDDVVEVYVDKKIRTELGAICRMTAYLC